MNNQKRKHIELVGLGLLWGSIFISLILYIIIMSRGFSLPNNKHFTDVESMFGWLNSYNEIGLWTGYVRNDGEIISSLSNACVTCLVFIVISLGLLISGFVICKKNKITATKYLRFTTIFVFAITAITFILSASAKITGNLTPIIDGTKNDLSISLWINFHIEGGFVNYGDHANILFNYTIQAIPVVILLSLTSVPVSILASLSGYNFLTKKHK